MMRKWLLVAVLAAVAGCAPAVEEGGLEAVILAEPVIDAPAEIETAPSVSPRKACPAQTDDGIGGTGCTAD